ncbi:MAG: glycosyltransferase family 2 protein [Planctomycetota bacterium]|nr:MAG: glycosyltransferase family 2 protein [Planctomycetota bacterium]
MGGADQIEGGRRPPLSVFVIAQDEEAHIADCLASASFAAELLVLDGGSRDRTPELAAAAGARVERRPFDGMNSQKNAALALCRQPWVLNLDADERVSPELRREIEALFAAGEPACAGYTMPRRAWHLGRWIRGGGWYPDRKLRLFRRDAGRFAGCDPHDKVVVDGPVGRLHGDLLHYAYRDLAHHEAKMETYTTAAARSAFAAGRRAPLLRMVLSPPLRFLKSYFLRAGFRDGRAGLILAWMAARYEWHRWRKLRRLRRGGQPSADC